MSTVELAAKQEPKKSPQNANQILTDADRALQARLFANPLDFPPEFRTWLEGFLETAIPTSLAVTSTIASLAFPVGYFRIIPEDLSANASEYVWTDDDTGLEFLYCNGAAVSQTTYADLYAKWGASKYAADSGGNFTLPDSRGRSLWFCGTNAACDLGDNDGVTEASRQVKHVHTDSLSASGTFVTSLNITSDSQFVEGATSFVKSITTNTSSPGISGSVGSGMSGSDAVAHYFIGSLVVRF